MKLPALLLYVGDWMKDLALRSCTIAARGLWIDMLALMFESHRRGYLQHPSGKPLSPDQLARMTGCSAEEVSRLLQELEDAGVFSRTDAGVIYSRRMVRDEAKREKCRAAGKLGGNPTLKGGVKGPVKGAVKGGFKGEPNRFPTPSSSSSSSKTEDKDKEPSPSERGGLFQPPPADATPFASPVVAERKQADTPHHRAVRGFLSAWRAKYGSDYPFDAARGKNAEAVKAVLAAVGGDADKFLAVAGRYLDDADPFVADQRHSLSLFRSQLQRWLVAAPPAASRAIRPGGGYVSRADADDAYMARMMADAFPDQHHRETHP